jgi:hypothetical protein
MVSQKQRQSSGLGFGHYLFVIVSLHLAFTVFQVSVSTDMQAPERIVKAMRAT